jgi:hypothetical protein
MLQYLITTKERIIIKEDSDGIAVNGDYIKVTGPVSITDSNLWYGEGYAAFIPLSNVLACILIEETTS